jgi:hypothetical protein
VNVAVRATDINTKDITVESEGVGEENQLFFLDLKNRNWMSFDRQLLESSDTGRPNQVHPSILDVRT